MGESTYKGWENSSLAYDVLYGGPCLSSSFVALHFFLLFSLRKPVRLRGPALN
ncbi:unnamed protein product [Penicillium roqueforti FM164]|uniref:Genomic scaffold, ProqFM164S01 n=1 Tax=Penicillium roqueforti (strain FM164) TaxID=1365484 RepID=W6QAQ2_PENRF|nr:unnamed protein product [Penicillium roqueforti FM164]